MASGEIDPIDELIRVFSPVKGASVAFRPVNKKALEVSRAGIARGAGRIRTADGGFADRKTYASPAQQPQPGQQLRTSELGDVTQNLTQVAGKGRLDQGKDG
jgi:hypothetical protein